MAVDIRLPQRRGTDCVRTTDASTRVGGWYVRLFTIRYGASNTHAYSKAGRPGALGPVAGFGVEVEHPEGYSTYHHELRDEDAARALYAQAVASPATMGAG